MKPQTTRYEDVRIDPPGTWANDAGPADWYALSDARRGIFAYAATEADAQLLAAAPELADLVRRLTDPFTIEEPTEHVFDRTARKRRELTRTEAKARALLARIDGEGEGIHTCRACGTTLTAGDRTLGNCGMCKAPINP